MAEPSFAGSIPVTLTVFMNYKKLKYPTPISRILDNTKFSFHDSDVDIGHKRNGKIFKNGAEYNLDNDEYVCYPLYFTQACKKSFSRKDHSNRIERAQKRRTKRFKSYNERPHGDSNCYLCGGTMSWCSCCNVYSRNCCVPYGTCQCS